MGTGLIMEDEVRMVEEVRKLRSRVLNLTWRTGAVAAPFIGLWTGAPPHSMNAIIKTAQLPSINECSSLRTSDSLKMFLNSTCVYVQ